MAEQQYLVAVSLIPPPFSYLAGALASLFIAGPLFLLARYLIRMNRRGLPLHPGYYLTLVLLAVLVPLSFWQVSNPKSEYAGWQLEDRQLRLFAPPVKTTIELETANLLLADWDSPWKPDWRTNGMTVPSLSTGWFKLHNGKKAVLFRHSKPEKILVIETGGSYYLLAHPGVEELYEHLQKTLGR